MPEEQALVLPQKEQATGNIDFSTYNSRSTSTRAGWEGNITDTELKQNDTFDDNGDKLTAGTNGFGVFAFFTGTQDYGSHTSKYPNFMYNERIYWDGSSAWKYDVLKPWPNSNTTADNKGATGDASYGTKVSFFAYAPYVKETTNWAGEGNGIIGMSTNANEGNPTITYKLAESGKIIDLLWGTCPNTKSYETVTGSTQTGHYFDPDKNTGNYYAATVPSTAPLFNGDESLFPVNINLVKQKAGEKVYFLFKHALAEIGGAGLQVQLDIDEGNSKREYYQVVTIRDIQISCSKQLVPDYASKTGDARYTTLYNKGTLDLATGRWSGLTSEGTTPSTKQVITSPGSSLTGSTATIRRELAEPASISSWDTFVNNLNSDKDMQGVQTTPTNVFSNPSDAIPLVLIPGTMPVLEFTIDYIVRVHDTKLKDTYSEVEQKISKTVEFTTPVELNKKYNILMHLGLTNVKFDATVNNWEDTNATQEVHLPINVK